MNGQRRVCRLMKCQTVDPGRGMFIVDARPVRVRGEGQMMLGGLPVYEDGRQRSLGSGLTFTVEV